jgi:hypothetical protein
VPRKVHNNATKRLPKGHFCALKVPKISLKRALQVHFSTVQTPLCDTAVISVSSLLFIGALFLAKCRFGVCSLLEGRGGDSGYSPTCEEKESLLGEDKSIYIRLLFGIRESKITFPKFRKIHGVCACGVRGYVVSSRGGGMSCEGMPRDERTLSRRVMGLVVASWGRWPSSYSARGRRQSRPTSESRAAGVVPVAGWLAGN